MNSRVVLINHDFKTITRELTARLGLPLSLNAIQDPTPEIAQQIYTLFLRTVLGISHDSLNQLPLSANVDLDPDMHKQSVPIILVYQAMKAFCKDNTDDKITLNMCDLVRPNKDVQRFRKMMSFLVDYLRFYDAAKPIFDQINEEFSDRKFEADEMRQELDYAEKKKEQLVARQTARKRRELDLYNDVRNVKEEFNEIVKKYEADMKEKNEIEKKKEGMIEEKARIEEDICSMKKLIEHLSAELMTSPIRIQNEIEKQKQEIIRTDQLLIEAKKRLEEHRRALDICGNSDKFIAMLTEKAKKWSMEKNEIKQLLDEVQDKRRMEETLEEELKLVKDKNDMTNERMIEHAKNHETIKNEHLTRVADIKKKVEAIKQEIDSMQNEQPKSSIEIDQKKRQLISVKNKNNQVISDALETTRTLVAQFEEISAIYESNEKRALEQSTAASRSASRLKNSCTQGLRRVDYTFSTSSIAESEAQDENASPANFNVFK